jgi:hypothetical protein
MKTHLIDMLLEVPHSRLPTIILNKYIHRSRIQQDIGLFQSRSLLRLWSEVLVRDDSLLFGDVSANLEDLHAIEEGSGDGFEVVGGADEEDSREVDRDVQTALVQSALEGRMRCGRYSLMIEEAVVLLGIEHLQESTSGVAIDTSTDLVHLVDEHERILGANALECLDDLARQRTVVNGIVSDKLNK